MRRALRFLFNPANAGNALDVKATEAAARTMGVTTHTLEVRAPSDFVNAFAWMTRERDEISRGAVSLDSC